MPSRDSVNYFGAGPAVLPTSVLEKVAASLLNYQGVGVGVAEISHRSSEAVAILNQTKADLADFLAIPTDDYEILFMQGGGTGQFSAVVYNLVDSWVYRKLQALLGDSRRPVEEIHGEELDQLVAQLRPIVEKQLKVDYLVTGSWSLKASQEAARLLGEEHVNIASDARKESPDGGKFVTIASEDSWSLSPDPAFVYFCDNETVDGVEFPHFPKVLESPSSGASERIVVADMSSNILSRKIPFEKYSLIFFGAQKNLSAAGLTVVIVKKNLLVQQKTPVTILRKLGLPIGPKVFDYPLTQKNNSLYNTLGIFDVYLAGQVLQKLLADFPDRVLGQERVAKEKATLIYDIIEANPSVYRLAVSNASVRSRMNIVFRIHSAKESLTSEATESLFLSGASERGLTGLKGHRSVGGIRISNYNAVSLQGIQKLADYMKQFAHDHT